MEKLQFVWDDKSTNTEGLTMIEKATMTAEQIKQLIFDTIDNVMMRGNAGVSVSFMTDGGVYINVYPFTNDDDEESNV